MDIDARTGVKTRELFRPPFLRGSIVVVLLGLGIGLVSFGFQLWIPSNLQKLGLGEAEASRLLRNSAIIGFPFNFLVAWLYGFWSSKTHADSHCRARLRCRCSDLCWPEIRWRQTGRCSRRS